MVYLLAQNVHNVLWSVHDAVFPDPRLPRHQEARASEPNQSLLPTPDKPPLRGFALRPGVAELSRSVIHRSMRSANFYGWLEQCQLDPEHEYYHGWADSREFIMELEREYGAFDFSVSETFQLLTPPPSSRIPMPVVSARTKKQSITFVENWLMEPYFTVSVRREFTGPIREHGILSPIGDDRPWLVEHLPPQFRYPPFQPEASEFVGAVQNRHMLYALFHILIAHETA